MDEFNKSSLPLFKKMDRAVFDRIDKFKLTPGYNNVQDFYNGLEEDQQKLFKAGVIVTLFLLPSTLLGLIWWQNNSLKKDLDLRVSLISKANEIIGQKQGLKDVSPNIVSENPIDGESMMSSRLSNLLSSVSVDLSKIQVKDYEGVLQSASLMRSEADFHFTNLSTDEMVNVFTAMIQREKFRIQSVDIKRNPENNLLQGQFHAVHFGAAQTTQGEE